MSGVPARERRKTPPGEGGRAKSATGSPSFTKKTFTGTTALMPNPNLPQKFPTSSEPSPGAFSAFLPSHCDSLFCGLCALRDQGLLLDWSLQLSGTSYRAHRLVLAAVSSTVELGLRCGEVHVEAELRGKVSREGLQPVLEFAYTGNTGITGVANCVSDSDILETCRSLGVERLSRAPPSVRRKGSVFSYASSELEVSLGLIRDLWKEGVGCDVWLQTECGDTVPAHRVILAAGGDYFRALLCGGLREAAEHVVLLHGVPGWALRALVGFLYSGELRLGWECVWELVQAATLFQLWGALSLCQDFLLAHMDDGSCLDVLALAEAYGLEELGREAEQYTLRHFGSVSGFEQFRDLSFPLLKRLLEKDSLCVDSECWVEEDLQERLCLLPDLLRHVRFGVMSFSELEQVRSCALLALESKDKLARDDLHDLLQPGYIKPPCNPRTPNQALVVVGGDFVDEDFTRRVPNMSLWLAQRFLRGSGLIRTVEWKSLAQLPEPARFRHCVCVLGNQLYVLGGRKYYGAQDILKSVVRFDPARACWERLSDMHDPRDYFAAVCLAGKVYVFGGNRDDAHYLDKVEFYTPEDDTWRLAHPLDTGLCGHAATVLDGEIFISGGCDTHLACLSSLWRYDPSRGSSARAPMVAGAGRAGHAMLALGGRLLVAGGLQPLWVGFGDQLECESYDPTLNTWALIPRLPRPHLFPAAVLLDGLLYLLGGSSVDSTRDTPWVHRYDPRTQLWDKLGALPHPYADLAACTLQLPAGPRE